MMESRREQPGCSAETVDAMDSPQPCQSQIADYSRLLREPSSTESITASAILGELRTSAVRGLVWRMQWRVLPLSSDEWPEILARSRQRYDEIKSRHVMDPRMQDSLSVDPSIVNPLSDAETNPWRKFFEDGDLRELIDKDVCRTFPEMEFFRCPKVRSMLADSLLVYAKEHDFVSYKQGMHEILAPLLFVLYTEQATYEHVKETGALGSLPASEKSILDVVYDKEFLEHDTYALFSEVMQEVCAWYEDGYSPTAEEGGTCIQSPRPFMRVQDAPPTSRLMDELAAIGETLSKVDPALHKHLSQLDIPPQLYGIRWLRLLFGREFPLHDLLFIWDVLFSQRPLARFVECMFVAMLMHIRGLLLTSDYSGALQYLMRYPPVADVATFLRLVLHLRYPSKYLRPRTDGSTTNYAHITVQGTAHPNRGRDSPIVLGQEVLADSPRRQGAASQSTSSLQPQQRPTSSQGASRSSSSLFGRGKRKEQRAQQSGSPTTVQTRKGGDGVPDRPASCAGTVGGNGGEQNGFVSYLPGPADDQLLDGLREAIRERDDRMSEASRQLRKLAAELSSPSTSTADDKAMARVAAKLSEIASDLSLRGASPESILASRGPAPAVRELKTFDSSRRLPPANPFMAINDMACGVESAMDAEELLMEAVELPDLPDPAAFRSRPRAVARRIGSTSSTESDASANADHPLKRHRQRYISCPVLFAASRF